MKPEEKIISLLDPENYGVEEVVSLEDFRDIYSSQYKWIVFLCNGGDDYCLAKYDHETAGTIVEDISLETGELISISAFADLIRTLEQVYEEENKDNFLVIGTKTREDAEFFIRDFKSWDKFIRSKVHSE